jgi:hypothetical protein
MIQPISQAMTLQRRKLGHGELKMTNQLRRFVTAAALLTVFSTPTGAVVIDFTGGTVTLLDGTTATTNNADSFDNVDYYEENGFRLDFQPNGSNPFSSHVGDYYDAGNDVIHAHWETGGLGEITTIEITKIGGGTFDLNYFILTSNTDTGGGAASGNEMAFIEGFETGLSTGAAMMLPTDDWGFPASQIFLGSAFDMVDSVQFTVTNTVDCFGMDEFFIDEPAPGVPVPGALALFGIGLAGLGYARKFRRN